ncbi:UNVERIFIED_ORG: hypothetical protein GGD51_000880 [Rhizobium esperanzae]
MVEGSHASFVAAADRAVPQKEHAAAFFRRE